LPCCTHWAPHSDRVQHVGKAGGLQLPCCQGLKVADDSLGSTERFDVSYLPRLSRCPALMLGSDTLWNGNIVIEAHDSVLVEIINELDDKYSIEVARLESRESDKITFSFKADTLEGLLRGLLRYLGVKNFAIEFADAAPTRIVVVPDSMSDITLSENVQTDQGNQIESLSVAQVQSIVELSQAESLDLTAGDIIIEYDGVRITSAQQLVEEVKNKPVPRRENNLAFTA